ncbi:Bfa1p SKDI_10G2550 [Saccharomyces kudriavzevii IFO 1802]|uniref:BFA1-like protein n=1 Tax=Saccharomyces kudriavzevii (strain ATCC MYA-4449 / AS 2.2408 / CBS 8840 / NBRC 1802 / NCYC 2889) TaxID=226230 RepID=A0AA35NJ87_SACK1|nr:uncharacterized protein SKDI_10G2550 [Saccharomyces kudriavzevii IFO 1802]CAI4043892.1 hypothetical protein SKDI_10G2550 [Saccharomyces kudriavzevii IFO 1802]
MSSRPLTLNGLEEPETSFEELNTTLPRFQPHETSPSRDNAPPLSTSTYIPTPSSVGTSDTGTIFSNSAGAFWSDKQGDNDQDMEVDQDDEFLNDFQEFQNKKDNFDDAIKTNFHLRNRCGTTPFKGEALVEEFDRRLNFDEKPRLKQPRSMMELKPKRILSNSVSSRNLWAGNSVRFKKSLPNLALVRPVIQEEEEEEQRRLDHEDDNDTQDTILAKFSSDDEGESLTGFEKLEDESLDETFLLNHKEGLDQPPFLKKNSASSLPLKISPTQYDIIKHDELLTPGLHRREREWNTQQELDSFKEERPMRHRSSQNVQLNGPAKIKTIKQQIDHNTPIKKGSMVYNPKSMRWEGNENVLNRFSDVDTANRKALLIKNKLQRNDYTKRQKKYSDLQNTRTTSRNQKVVGNMVLDEQNLRWVSVSEEEADPFAGIPEINLPPVKKTMKKRSSSPFLRSQSQLSPLLTSKGNNGVYQSAAAQARLRKYHSMRTLNIPADDLELDPTFNLDSRTLERFYHEENRWSRKLAPWFIPRDEAISVDEETIMDESTINGKRKSYMYEIRNMVINSTKD